MKKTQGYTLPEMMISLLVFGLLTLGVMTLYITMLRLCVNVTGANSATLDAANAVSRVTGILREANNFELMDGVGPSSGTDFSTAYDATDTSGAVVAVTGVRITFPRAVGTITVNTPTASSVALSGSNALWDIKQTGQTLDIFRANADGTANPNTGKYLWMRGTENGVSVNTAIIKSIAPTRDAVQFIQPHDAGGQALVNQIKVKIASAFYDPLRGVVSSDSATQVTTFLTGECVYLRDHNPTGASSVGAHGQHQVDLGEGTGVDD